jgi:hypothetical protein
MTIALPVTIDDIHAAEKLIAVAIGTLPFSSPF